jgi:hypothetical protein
MNQLQAILKVVGASKPTSGFSVSSIWVTEKMVVLESSDNPVDANQKGAGLCNRLRFMFPGITTELYPPDSDGTTISIGY